MTEPAHKNTSTKPDVLAIMAEIRNRVKQEVKSQEISAPRRPLKLLSADADARATRKAGELLHSEELRYLNINHASSSRLDPATITSHRTGIIGRLIVRFKQKLVQMLSDSVLKEYLNSQREFQSNLVRHLNDVSKYVDARDAANFWEIVRKVEHDVTRLEERLDRSHDDEMASMRATEKRIIDRLGESPEILLQRLARLDQHEEKLNVMDSVVRGLEHIIAHLGKPQHESVAPKADTTAECKDAATDTRKVPDFSYVLLENRYRGSEEQISQKLKMYVEVFLGAKKPVLEIGSGRGELQALFQEAQVGSYGIDSDEAMVQVARAKGVDVTLGDGIAHLRASSDRSLGGVIAIQVAEHLPNAVLDELLLLCHSKVDKGGRIVLETINPQSITALSSNFYRDPTHVWPLHPDTLAYRMSLAGLKVLEIRKLSPVPEEALLREVDVEGGTTPRLTALQTINRNFKQLNDLLFGHQDYCIIAEV